ncbi:hypothetical protein HNQ02_003422 [Flavobacterium sp. 7E]|uniref:hypothetical protein n=1 Tax=unclassified Flavobacterium TaxID=196869 RepID=UPI00156E1615|nr:MULTISPECIES: hypothetical protein [unclassified Flavobacterium]MBE0391192.1 hypothetical protein [Flavobacterium sp. PL002]NRS90478.1 hypothetical protein [Flavobacterium sp. 7E]NRT16729.1 hypothetical protein [Flavobacterium sp. 28A]
MKEFKLENSTKIETGFSTPENYFEDFSAKLMLKIPQNDTAEAKVIPFFKRRKTSIMLVAALLVIGLMIPIAFNQTKKIATTELDDTTLENYLSYQSNMSQYDLINSLESEDLQNIETENTTSLEQETIEDLLVDNGNLEHYIIE